jgi:hypothetical protein
MANTGSERITNMFRFKHQDISVPEITATNRIIHATKRLTATIAGMQEAPLDKMEAIQSLCTLLLGEVALLPPPAPSILPTPLVLTYMVKQTHHHLEPPGSSDISASSQTHYPWH